MSILKFILLGLCDDKLRFFRSAVVVGLFYAFVYYIYLVDIDCAISISRNNNTYCVYIAAYHWRLLVENNHNSCLS